MRKLLVVPLLAMSGWSPPTAPPPMHSSEVMIQAVNSSGQFQAVNIRVATSTARVGQQMSTAPDDMSPPCPASYNWCADVGDTNTTGVLSLPTNTWLTFSVQGATATFNYRAQTSGCTPGGDGDVYLTYNTDTNVFAVTRHPGGTCIQLLIP